MRRLAWVCFSFAAAAAVGVLTGGGLWFLFAGLGCIAGYAGLKLAKPDKLLRYGALVLLGFGLGAGWFSTYTLLRVSPIKELYGSTCQITAQVLQEPKDSGRGYRLVCRTELADTDCRVILYTHERPELQLGDRLTLRVTVADYLTKRPDTDLMNQSKDISAVCYQKSELSIDREGRNDWTLLPQRIAAKCRQTLRDLYCEDTEGILIALLTGDKTDMSYQTRSDFSRSGISHAVAVSGMHISILMSLLSMAFGMRRGGRIVMWLMLPLFAAVTGFSPSAMRAVIMQLILLAATYGQHDYDMPTALGFSLLINLLLNPWAIADVSLQMSYAAVSGIYLITQPIYASLVQTGRISKIKHLDRLLRSVCQILAATLGALIFTVPLSLLHFGASSVVSLLTNLLTSLAFTFCFGLGLMSVLLGLIWQPLGQLAAWPTEPVAHWIAWVAERIAAWQWAALTADNAYLIAGLVFGYVVAAICMIGRLRDLRLPLCCFALIAMLCLFLNVLDSSERQPGITAVDVGQGACTVLDLGDAAAMVDCGGSRDDEAGECAADFLNSRGIDRLELLILTHYDRDHVGGVEQLMHRIGIDLLVLPDTESDSAVRSELEQLAGQHHTTIQYVTEDLELKTDGGSLTILAPVSEQSSNASSLCVLSRIDGMTSLITGDLDISSEYLLLYKLTDVDLDVLVAGHHGSKTSTSESFLRLLRPEVVLISVGENAYGHPAPETISRIENTGACIYRTDLCGNVTINCNGE